MGQHRFGRGWYATPGLPRGPIVGPEREEDDEDGKEVWQLHYVNEEFHSALELIDGALLTIDGEKGE